MVLLSAQGSTDHPVARQCEEGLLYTHTHHHHREWPAAAPQGHTHHPVQQQGILCTGRDGQVHTPGNNITTEEYIPYLPHIALAYPDHRDTPCACTPPCPPCPAPATPWHHRVPGWGGGSTACHLATTPAPWQDRHQQREEHCQAGAETS